MRTIRVFPRRTNATPTDELAYIGDPTLFAEADRVMVSCAFTWDIPEAERLAEAWKWIAPVELGGPAFNRPGGEFEPGKFLKPGYVITSRGCPNRCWFCSVWKRDPVLKELEIKDGWNVQDDNLLACSEEHIRAVFAMLKRQRHKATFKGGIEAARLEEWHIDLLAELKPERIYMAYDTPNDYEPLRIAAQKLHAAGFTRTVLCAYVLIGYPRDTMENAERRLQAVKALGVSPFAMLYRDQRGEYDRSWRGLQRMWARPEIIWSPVVAL